MSLPITRAQAYAAAKFIKTHFSQEIAAAVTGSPFTINHLCGIACQESAYFWLNFLNDLSPAQILARCVLDASGDFPDTQRRAFPRNSTEFASRYDAAFTRMLIDEANQTRILRGFQPKNWVYKGYGLFQYDLQHVLTDETFFRDRKWYLMGECLFRSMNLLNEKYRIYQDIWKAIKAYNGTGPAATRYANNVMQFAAYCAEV